MTHSYDQSLFPFTSRRVQIEGHQLHYIDEGQGPTLLFCHPPLGSIFMHRSLFKKLSSNFRCIAVDFPGFGLSEAANGYEYTIGSQSDVLKKFILKLSLRDIILLGHDTGGPSGFMVAAQHPDWFKGFILTDTIIFPVSEYSRISTMLGIVNSPIFSWLNKRFNFLLRVTLSRGIRTKKLSKQEKSVYFKMFNTPEKRSRIIKILFSLKENELMMKSIKTAFEGVLKNYPTLLIYGEKDPVHQMGITVRIQEMMTNTELHLIENEGHFPHEAAGEVMAAKIMEWYEELKFSAAIKVV